MVPRRTEMMCDFCSSSRRGLRGRDRQLPNASDGVIAEEELKTEARELGTPVRAIPAIGSLRFWLLSTSHTLAANLRPACFSGDRHSPPLSEKSVTTILPWRINYLRKIACCARASLELEENQCHRHSDAFWLRGPTEPARKVRQRRQGRRALPKTPSATACSPAASSWIRNPAHPSKPC